MCSRGIPNLPDPNAEGMRRYGGPPWPDPMFHGGTVDLGGGPKFGINTQSPVCARAEGRGPAFESAR